MQVNRQRVRMFLANGKDCGWNSETSQAVKSLIPVKYPDSNLRHQDICKAYDGRRD